MSLAAFRWGRMAVVDRAFVEAEIAKAKAGGSVQDSSAAVGSAQAIVDAIGAQGEVKRCSRSACPT
jgi:indolepyruvate ferredoxin oxidoreductase